MEELGHAVFMPHILPVQTWGPKATPCESVTASEAHRAPQAYLPSGLTLTSAAPFFYRVKFINGNNKLYLKPPSLLMKGYYLNSRSL